MSVEHTEAIVATAPALIFGKSMVPLGTAARLGARAASLRPLGTPSSFHHLGRRRMASVTVYGPKAMDNSRELFPTLGYAIGSFDACGWG